MKKSLLLFLAISLASICYSQVGINTEFPKGTLHVVPAKVDGSTAEGLIAPNLTRLQLISKDGQYTISEKGAIVYVSDLSGTTTTKTVQVTAVGYYYFDGTLWQRFVSSFPEASVTTANNGLSMSGTTTQLGGALTKATSITGASTLTLATPTTLSGALRISSGTPGVGKVLTSDGTGNASWQQPGFSQFTRIPYTNISVSIPSAHGVWIVYNGVEPYRIELPDYGTYSITMGVRLLFDNFLANSTSTYYIIQLLPGVDPNLWSSSSLRFEGSYEIYSTQGLHNADQRFYISENITVTPTTGKTIYFALLFRGTNLPTTLTGNISFGTGGGSPQASGGSYLKIN